MNRATLAALSCLLASAACGAPQTAEPQTSAESHRPTETEKAEADIGPMPSVAKEDLVVGSGPEVKKGDHVLFGKFSGTEIDGVLVMSEDDVLMVLE